MDFWGIWGRFWGLFGVAFEVSQPRFGDLGAPRAPTFLATPRLSKYGHGGGGGLAPPLLQNKGVARDSPHVFTKDGHGEGRARPFCHIWAWVEQILPLFPHGKD